MSILTAKRTWKRKPTPKRRVLRTLTPTASANVRRVLRYLTVEHGVTSKLADAARRDLRGGASAPRHRR